MLYYYTTFIEEDRPVEDFLRLGKLPFVEKNSLYFTIWLKVFSECGTREDVILEKLFKF